MGITPSYLSIFGMLALAGVVVNDSLVMVDFINRRREEGMRLRKAILTAGGARFRPILLTSITTFAGLMPLMFDRSIQAQFLIPMAVSLGFGILFATSHHPLPHPQRLPDQRRHRPVPERGQVLVPQAVRGRRRGGEKCHRRDLNNAGYRPTRKIG